MHGYQTKKSVDVKKIIRNKYSRADTIFVFDPKTCMDLSDQDLANLEYLEMYQSLLWMVEVRKMVSGASFGELALINREPRAATIKAVTNCYFATLDKEDYTRILMKIEIREQTEQLMFIQ